MAILLALVSALAYGTGDYCGGRATRRAPVLLVVLVTQSVAALLAFAVIVVDGAPWPGGADVGWSVAAGASSLLGIATFYEALARGAMTVVAPLTAVVGAVVPVVVGITTGERPAVVALLGVVLALVAVALVAGVGGRADRPTPRRVVVQAVMAGIGFGLLFVFLARTSDESGFWPLGIVQVTSCLFVGVALAVRRPRPPVGVPGPWTIAALAGVCNVVANVAYLLATRRGLLSLVAVVTSLYPGTTVALATLLDRERPTRTQAVGMVLALAAVAMVGAGS